MRIKYVGPLSPHKVRQLDPISFSHDHKMKERRHVKNEALLMLLVIAIFVNNRSLQVIPSARLPIHDEVGAIAVPSSVPIRTSR